MIYTFFFIQFNHLINHLSTTSSESERNVIRNERDANTERPRRANKSERDANRSERDARKSKRDATRSETRIRAREMRI